MNNREIVKKFAAGAKKGHSNSMAIVQLPNSTTALIGYGWAIYAKRRGKQIIVYDGWRGYSTTTSHHMGLIRPYATKISKASPRL